MRRITGALRRLLRPVLGPAVATVRRASVLDERFAFVRRELTRSRATSAYHLRGTGLILVVRHGTPDVYGLDQAFVQRHFDPPPDVSDLLGQLGARIRVADLGANIGLYGVHISKHFRDAEIVAFEPDASNAAVLRAVVAANGAQNRWRVVEACATTRDGTVRFEVGQFGVSRVVEDGASAAEVPAVDVFGHLDGVDLVKMDIEGAEWEILDDGRLSAVTARVMNVEYHSHRCPEDDPSAHARRLLERAGYRVVDGARLGPREGILWAWRHS